MTWMQIKTFLDNANSIFRPRSLTFDPDLWPLHLGRNIPLFIYTFPTKVQYYWTFLDEVTGKNSIFRPSSLTFDLGRISPKILSVYLLVMRYPCAKYDIKSTQEFSRYCDNEVKIALLDQVHWPLTLAGSCPKSNQFIYSSWGAPVPSMITIHPGVLQISR